MTDVAIIGGGVSGLATAFALKRRGYRVAVLERQTRPGGNAVSERSGGFLMEHGPSTVATSSATARAMSADLGLDAHRCTLGDGVKQRYLVRDGRLHGIPVHPLGFLTSGYLPLGARLRVLAEAAVRKGDPGVEETVAQFCTRRFGAEFSDRVIDPLVGGIYAGRADELSVSAVFPKLVDLERHYGSVTKALFHRHFQGGRMPGQRFYSWRDGIGALPRALARCLREDIRTGIAVRRLRPIAGGYRVDAGAAGTFTARAVVVATQPHVAAQLLDGVDDTAASAAGAIQAPPLAVVFLGYRRGEVDHPLDGFGFLTPPGEGRALTGAQFCSTMFAGRAPDGHVAIAGYVGGARNPDLARLPAADLIDLVRGEFTDLIGARGEPVTARVRNWPLGLPQYTLGHGERVASLQDAGRRRPGLFITGNYFQGPSVAACLDLSHTTADQVERYLVDRREEARPTVAARPGAGHGNPVAAESMSIPME